jgi:hypothetical protein
MALPPTDVANLNGWLVSASPDGQYLYIQRDGSPGQVHLKAEDEGLVVDLWNDHEPMEVVATAAAAYTELERE